MSMNFKKFLKILVPYEAPPLWFPLGSWREGFGVATEPLLSSRNSGFDLRISCLPEWSSSTYFFDAESVVLLSLSAEEFRCFSHHQLSDFFQGCCLNVSLFQPQSPSQPLQVSQVSLSPLQAGDQIFLPFLLEDFIPFLFLFPSLLLLLSASFSVPFLWSDKVKNHYQGGKSTQKWSIHPII